MKLARVVLFSAVFPVAIWACGDDDTGSGATPGTDGGSSEAGSSGTDGATSSGNDANASDSGTEAAAACAPSTATTKIQPTNLAILLDRSGSMLDDNKWTTTTNALKVFVTATSSAGTTASLTFFNDATAVDVCAPATYATPKVGFTALPSDAFTAPIAGQSPGGESATVPALMAVLGAASAQAFAHPEQATAVVLITDGDPSGCVAASNSVAAAEKVASDARPLPTYVIALADSDHLKAIATAGGTTAITAIGAVPTAEALTRIRDELKCRLPLPKPSSGVFDPAHATVTIPASTTALPFGDCAAGDAPGWHLDSATDLTRLVLCPASCKALGTAEATVEFDCPNP